MNRTTIKKQHTTIVSETIELPAYFKYKMRHGSEPYGYGQFCIVLSPDKKLSICSYDFAPSIAIQSGMMHEGYEPCTREEVEAAHNAAQRMLLQAFLTTTPKELPA